MYNLINKKYYLILANFKPLYITLLLIVGVFLFPKIAYMSSITPEHIIELSNKERANQGLQALTANQLLTQAAHSKAIAIFNKQKFAHKIEDRRFSSWIQDTGYEYRYVGENLAIDFLTSEGVVNAWIDSPSHYENLISNKFSEIGVAVVEDVFKKENSIVVVQIFGTPLNLDNKINIIEKEAFADNKNFYTQAENNKNMLSIISNNEKFLQFNKENNTSYVPEKKENKNKLEDYIFTLFGFIYLGIFKLVTVKNNII
jgi:hypothetical protein